MIFLSLITIILLILLKTTIFYYIIDIKKNDVSKFMFKYNESYLKCSYAFIKQQIGGKK